MVQVLEVCHREGMQCPAPAVDVIRAVQVANTLGQGLAIGIRVVQLRALAQCPLIDHRHLGDVPALWLEVLLEPFCREQRRQHCVPVHLTGA
ncbi:hypothetical protein D9M71_394720 [compost metagenome]